MQWTDDGVVLGIRKHGESGIILEMMTRAHGRHLGLVHGGRAKAMQPVLQPGNTVEATWRARLDEHLGECAGCTAYLQQIRTTVELLAYLNTGRPHPPAPADVDP